MAEYIKKDELLKFKADVYDEDGHVLYAVPTESPLKISKKKLNTIRLFLSLLKFIQINDIYIDFKTQLEAFLKYIDETNNEEHSE